MPSPYAYHARFSPAETPSPSAPSVTAISSATLTSTRDRDLISSDELLTDDALDELWVWFCGAAKGGTDPQLVFVKLINFARKPYMKHSDVTSTRSRSMISATPRSSASDIDAPTDTQLQAHQALQTTVTQLRQESAHQQTTVTQLRQEGAQLQTTITQLHQQNAQQGAQLQKSAHLQITVTQLRQEVAELQTTITQLRQQNAQQDVQLQKNAHLQITVTQLRQEVAELQTTVTQLRHENTQLQSKAQSLTPIIPAPVRVAIKSVHFSCRYVQLRASDFRSYHPAGGGHVGVQTYIGGCEAFVLVHHPGGLVSFKAAWFENIFLRAEAKGLHPGQTPDGGGGVVNCQYGCGRLEKFRIVKAGTHGEVVIEPAEFPGRYLRVDGNCLDSMNLQGAVRTWEKFYLVILP